jgi:flagella basal body P-ring formation protein FlgA
MNRSIVVPRVPAGVEGPAPLSMDIQFKNALTVPGPSVASVTIDGADGVIKTVIVPIQIRMSGPVLAAVSMMPSGKTFSPDIATIRTIDMTRPADEYVTSLEQLSGRRARRPIGAGSPILWSDTESSPTIRRGEFVTLTLGEGALKVSLLAVAGKDGRVGDVIPVRTSGKRPAASARVTAEGTLVALP